MHFEFDLRSDNFILPAMSVRPLAENAVKHGLMKLEKGGTIRITTYEISTAYCVKVQDTGVGFDVAAPEPGTGHIGLRNSLREVGAEEILVKNGYPYSVDADRLDCDWFRRCQTGAPPFYGEYMAQYSWAEEPCALL